MVSRGDRRRWWRWVGDRRRRDEKIGEGEKKEGMGNRGGDG